MKLIDSIKNYLKESVHELKKVTWPTKKETLNYSVTVIIFSLIVAAFLGTVDYVLSQILEKLI